MPKKYLHFLITGSNKIDKIAFSNFKGMQDFSAYDYRQRKVPLTV